MPEGIRGQLSPHIPSERRERVGCMRCLVAALGCGSIRGMCCRCYNRAVHRIKKGLTTWSELEAAGKCLPRKKRSWER